MLQDMTLLDCYQFAFATLQRVYSNHIPADSDPQEINFVLGNSLSLIKAVLSFDFHPAFSQDSSQLEFEKVTMSLPLSWSSKIQFQESATLVFNVYERGDAALQRAAFSVLLHLMSVPSRFHRDAASFWGLVLDRIGEVIERDVHFYDGAAFDNVQTLSLIVLKAKFSIDHDLALRIGGFQRFVEAAFSLTTKLVVVDVLHENPQTVVNVLKFWDLMTKTVSERSSDPDAFTVFLLMLGEVSRNYIEVVMDCISEYPRDSVALLFDDLTELSPFVQLVTRIGKFIADPFYSDLLSTFQRLLAQFKENPHNDVVEAQLSFFACVLLSPVCIRYVVQSAETSYLPLFALPILGMIHDTGVLVGEGVRRLLVERVVLFMIAQVSKSFLILGAHQTPDLPVIAQQSDGKYNTVNDILALFFTRIVLSLKKLGDEPRIVEPAIETIMVYLENSTDSYHKNTSATIKDVLIGQLLNFEDEEQFAFLEFPENKRSRVKFNQMMAQLISQEKRWHPKFQQFSSMINQKLARLQQEPNEEVAAGLLLDVRGLFHGVTTRYPYIDLFQWFYPGPVTVLHATVVQFPSLQRVYLKFLIEFVSNTKSRIMLENHSANGLKMFKTAAASLIHFFTTLRSPEGSTDANVHANAKPFTDPMKAMEVILTNQFSNIGALEVYNDRTLKKLLVEFLHVARETDLIAILRFPKIASCLMKLLCCLFDRFITHIMDIDWQFLPVALSICTLSNAETDRPDVESVFKIIAHITQFCTDNEGTKIGKRLYEATRDVYNQIQKMLEEMIFNYTQSRNYEITTVMANILKMRPTMWPEVGHRLSLFLLLCENDERQGSISGLIEMEVPENGPLD
jgi:exportin-7